MRWRQPADSHHGAGGLGARATAGQRLQADRFGQRAGPLADRGRDRRAGRVFAVGLDRAGGWDHARAVSVIVPHGAGTS